MADIDKKALIDEGCNLLNEAIAEMRKAQKLYSKKAGLIIGFIKPAFFNYILLG